MGGPYSRYDLLLRAVHFYKLTEDTICRFKLGRWDAREGNNCRPSYIKFVIRKQRNKGLQRD
jgi:hypothetical protein